MFRFFFKQERCKDERLQSKYACADQPSAPGCRTDGAINRCMGSVSATSGPDTELQVPDEILQHFGMKTSFSKDVPKLSIIVLSLCGEYVVRSFLPDGVFLPCDHELDFLHKLIYMRIQSINQSTGGSYLFLLPPKTSLMAYHTIHIHMRTESIFAFPPHIFRAVPVP